MAVAVKAVLIEIQTGRKSINGGVRRLTLALQLIFDKPQKR